MFNGFLALLCLVFSALAAESGSAGGAVFLFGVFILNALIAAVQIISESTREAVKKRA